MSSTVGFSGRSAPGCHDFRSAALETTTASISRRALRGRCDGFKRRYRVGVVRNDDLNDHLRSGGFARLPDPLELREGRAVPHIGMTDEKAGLKYT